MGKKPWYVNPRGGGGQGLRPAGSSPSLDPFQALDRETASSTQQQRQPVAYEQQAHSFLETKKEQHRTASSSFFPTQHKQQCHQQPSSHQQRSGPSRSDSGNLPQHDNDSSIRIQRQPEHTAVDIPNPTTPPSQSSSGSDAVEPPTVPAMLPKVLVPEAIRSYSEHLSSLLESWEPSPSSSLATAPPGDERAFRTTSTGTSTSTSARASSFHRFKGSTMAAVTAAAATREALIDSVRLTQHTVHMLTSISAEATEPINLPTATARSASLTPLRTLVSNVDDDRSSSSCGLDREFRSWAFDYASSTASDVR